MYALYTTQKRNKQAGSNSLKQHNCNAQLADKRTQCNTVHSVQAIAGEERGAVGALWTHLIPGHCVCRYYDADSALSWPNAVDSRRTMAPLATTSLSRIPTPLHPIAPSSTVPPLLQCIWNKHNFMLYQQQQQLVCLFSCFRTCRSVMNKWLGLPRLQGSQWLRGCGLCLCFLLSRVC